jgi:hypothetical protein
MDPNDIIGKIWDCWQVVSFDKTYKGDNRYLPYQCLCNCGKIKALKRSEILRERIKSCGCLITKSNRKRIKDLTDKRFGRLSVVKYEGPPTEQREGSRWLCSCMCGNQIISSTSLLNSGKVRSCGCLATQRQKHKPNSELLGKQYGKLTIIDFSAERSYRLICRCECGNVVESRYYDLRDGKTSACGCLQRRRGQENPNYKGGDKRQRPITRIEYKTWRKSVYCRDNYTCQSCFDRGKNLNAHHLDCWADYVDKRYEMNNGITLCENCHNAFHKTFGKKTNRSQFYQWIWKNYSNKVIRYGNAK